MFRFLPTVDKVEARRHWHEVHAPLVAKIPGLAAYTQGDPVERIGAGMTESAETWDAYIAHWYPDEATFQAAMKSPEWAAIDADGGSFVDMTYAPLVAVDERVIVDGPRAGFKVVWMGRFKEGLARTDASDYWTEAHGSLRASTGGLKRYVQNHTTKFLWPVSDDDPGYDGVGEVWYADRDAYLESVQSAAGVRAEADDANFADRARSWAAVVDERFVKGP